MAQNPTSSPVPSAVALYIYVEGPEANLRRIEARRSNGHPRVVLFGSAKWPAEDTDLGVPGRSPSKYEPQQHSASLAPEVFACLLIRTAAWLKRGRKGDPPTVKGRSVRQLAEMFERSQSFLLEMFGADRGRSLFNSLRAKEQSSVSLKKEKELDIEVFRSRDEILHEGENPAWHWREVSDPKELHSLAQAIEHRRMHASQRHRKSRPQLVVTAEDTRAGGDEAASDPPDSSPGIDGTDIESSQQGALSVAGKLPPGSPGVVLSGSPQDTEQQDAAPAGTVALRPPVDNHLLNGALQAHGQNGTGEEGVASPNAVSPDAAGSGRPNAALTDSAARIPNPRRPVLLAAVVVLVFVGVIASLIHRSGQTPWKEIRSLPPRVEANDHLSLELKSDEEIDVLENCEVAPGGELRIRGSGTLRFAEGAGIDCLGHLLIEGDSNLIEGDTNRRLRFTRRENDRPWCGIQLRGESAVDSCLRRVRISGARGREIKTFEPAAALMPLTLAVDGQRQRWGGALLLAHTNKITIEGVWLDSNEADRGGALAIYDSQFVTMHDCDFVGNQSRRHDSTHGKGGAVYTANVPPTVTFSKCRFRHNLVPGKYSCGGAMYVDFRSSIEIRSCEFSSNFAYHLGGAVYLFSHKASATDQSPPAINIIRDCKFIDNYVAFWGSADLDGRGSAVYADDGIDLRINNETLFQSSHPCRRHASTEEWCAMVGVDAIEGNRSALRLVDCLFKVGCDQSEVEKASLWAESKYVRVENRLKPRDYQVMPSFNRTVSDVSAFHSIDTVFLCRASRERTGTPAQFRIGRDGTITRVDVVSTERPTVCRIELMGLAPGQESLGGDPAFDEDGFGRSPAWTYHQYHALNWLLDGLSQPGIALRITGHDERGTSADIGLGPTFRWEYLRDDQNRWRGARGESGRSEQGDSASDRNRDLEPK
jgi:hypothetical protein